MRWNKKYIYPKSTREISVGQRLYNINNERLPSVTTILNDTQSDFKRESLKKWREKIGDKEAEKILKTSSQRGTAMHKHLEEYLIGQNFITMPGLEEEARLMSQIIINKGLSHLDELWGCEVTVYMPKMFAGTSDAIGVYQNKESIIDFKQSNKPKKKEWITDYFFQVGAYALAHNHIYNSNITQGVILVCTPPPNMEFQEFIICDDEFSFYQEEFI